MPPNSARPIRTRADQPASQSARRVLHRRREAGPGADPEQSYLYELLRIPSGVLYHCFPTMRARYQSRMPCSRILPDPARGRTPVNDTTILVVDDEPQIRRVLRTTLSSSGCDVAEAIDGQHAGEMVIRARLALLVVDDNMAGMSGREAWSKSRLSVDGPR